MPRKQRTQSTLEGAATTASRRRWESRLTCRALEEMDVPYHVVVEPQEYENYASVLPLQHNFFSLRLHPLEARSVGNILEWFSLV